MGPNLDLKEMRKITKDLAQGHSQEVEEGPQLQASTEEGGASKHPQLSITTSAHPTGAFPAGWNRFVTATF